MRDILRGGKTRDFFMAGACMFLFRVILESQAAEARLPQSPTALSHLQVLVQQ